MHGTLYLVHWLQGKSSHTNRSFHTQLYTLRARDGKVNIWTIAPNPKDSSPWVAPTPTEVAYTSDSTQTDITSLSWNPDGTLLAIGSYDSVLRIAQPNGQLYFSHPQHVVSHPFLLPPCLRSPNTCIHFIYF